eukprot:gene11295-11445_t
MKYDYDQNTFLDPNLTYVWDKVVCVRAMYFVHVAFCYLVFLSGILAMVSRLVPTFKWSHVWFGRAYIISMLWATASSLIIHNTGLPAATLISFIWALGGMCFAWILIIFHEMKMDRLATANVQQAINKVGGIPQGSLRDMIAAEKGRIAASKTFRQRMLSIKAVHGAIMFTSWINIAGRIFASNQSGDFTCHTYPVYKKMNTPHGNFADQPLTLVPLHDPKFRKLPWARLGLAGWGVVMFVAPFIGAIAIGALVAWLGARRSAKGITAAVQADDAEVATTNVVVVKDKPAL